MGYIFLFMAIVAEVIGTNFLKASHGFSKMGPTVFTLLLYFFCFYFLAQAIKTIPLTVAYTLWAGFGVVLSACVAVFFWKEPIHWQAILGIGLIICGTVLLQTFSASAH